MNGAQVYIGVCWRSSLGSDRPLRLKYVAFCPELLGPMKEWRKKELISESSLIRVNLHFWEECTEGFPQEVFTTEVFTFAGMYLQ